MVAHSFNPSNQEAEAEAGFCEFEARQFYKVSSRTAKGILHREILS